MRFGGGESDSPINGLAGVEEHFGEDTAREHASGLRAALAYVRIAELYFLSPVGSEEETVAGFAFDNMNDGLLQNPAKASSLAQLLAALVVHLKNGNSFDEWFEGVEE